MSEILIPFQDFHFKSVGGPSTFMPQLRRFMDEKGFRYYCRAVWGYIRGVRAIFFPIAYNIYILKYFKKKGIKIIQRLDGVYYSSKHGDRHAVLNHKMKDIHNALADVVVYQSRYSKAQCEAMFGVTKAETYVIVNGADSRLFYPSKEREFVADEIRFITTGNFRNIDMIEPVVKALDRLASKFKFKLVVVGPITNTTIRPLFERDYIQQKGFLNRNDVARELRSSDIFVYAHLNPPCPNSVIEAISCGLPIVGFRSGAMEELLPFNTQLLAEVSSELFQEYKDFHEERLAEKIELAVEDYPRHRRLALDNAHLYPFDRTGRQYLEVFEKTLAKAAIGP